MRGRTLTVLIIGFAAAIVCSTTVRARQIEDWPYEKLFKKADVIVVAKVLSVEDAGKNVTDKAPDEDLVGVITTFQLQYSIKGDCKDKKFSVFHYRLKEGAKVVNGPLLVSFHAKEVRKEYGEKAIFLPPPEYMLFLKKREDGRYECISGQFDPKLSVKQIIDPLPDPSK